jgi:hypothetical protein
MAGRMRLKAACLDTIERPFYIRTIHTTLYSPRSYPTRVPDARPDGPESDFHAPLRAFIP